MVMKAPFTPFFKMIQRALVVLLIPDYFVKHFLNQPFNKRKIILDKMTPTNLIPTTLVVVTNTLTMTKK
ncbi:MAG TPA: hypothetical protein DDZ34_05720 [Syntrophaceae bacterium]|nr:hypothetical protein [Syntrophaceae bacterium]